MESIDGSPALGLPVNMSDVEFMTYVTGAAEPAVFPETLGWHSYRILQDGRRVTVAAGSGPDEVILLIPDSKG
jgi:hypothetical protein